MHRSNAVSSCVGEAKDAELDWKFASPELEEVRTQLLPLLSCLDDHPMVHVVKRKAFRAVYRVQLPRGAVYVKWGRARSFGDGLRNRLWPSRLATEWRQLHRLRERGVPTIRPIALIERRSRGCFREEWFVSAEVPGATLAEKLGAPDCPLDIAGVGRWVRRLHDGGVQHRDLHPGNLLLSPEVLSGASDPVPLLVDVDDLVLGRRPTSEQRARDLASFIDNATRIKRLAPGEARELVHAYCEGWSETRSRRQWERVRRVSERQGRSSRRHWVRRALSPRSSRYIDHMLGDTRLRTQRPFDPGDVEGAWKRFQQQRFDDGDAAGAIHVSMPDGLRRIRWQRFGDGADFAGSGMNSLAVRAWQGSVALWAWQVPGPRVVAWARSTVSAHDDFVAIESGASAEVAPFDPRDRHSLVQAGACLAHLHGAGLGFGGDVSPEDFVAGAESPQRVHFSLDACARLRWRRTQSPQRAHAEALDLARSIENRAGAGAGEHFLRAYRESRRPDALPTDPVALPAPPRRILLVKLGAIGDVVNTLPLAVRLAEHFPDAEVAWLVGRKASSLLDGHPSLAQVFVFPGFGQLRACRKLWRELRAFAPDLAIDAGMILKSAFWSRASGAARVLGFDRIRAKEGSWLASDLRVPFRPGHGTAVETFLELAEALGACPGDPRWQLEAPKAAEREADALLAETTGSLVAVTVGATKPANLWRGERIAQICARLSARGATPVLIGGPDDRQRADWIEAMAGRGVLNLVGRSALPTSLAVIRRSAALLAHDTGPLHLAVALGTPSLALFGAANPLRTGPHSRGDRVVRVELRCAPCRSRRCPLGTRACMSAIESDRVWEHLEALLDGRDAPSGELPAPRLRPMRESRDNWKMLRAPDAQLGGLRDRLHDLEACFEAPDAQVFNAARTAVTVAIDEPVAGRLFLKRYGHRDRIDAWKNRLRPSRGRKAWQVGRRLFEMGFAVGAPLALAERKIGPWTERSVLITRGVEHEGDVLEWWRDHRDPAERRRFTRALGLHLAQLHAERVFFHDLKGSNLLVQRSGEALHFAHVDFDRVRLGGRIREADLVQNLLYLNTSFGDALRNSDRLRLLRAYLGPAAADRARLRRIAARVISQSGERSLRRRPPLQH